MSSGEREWVAGELGLGGGGRGLVLPDAARGIIPLTGKGEFITARNILDEDI